ncbi:defensin-like protein 183 [Vicia villosa]|uniref:defensin-like protein 183 n=1 Tax=Vicia villosa TaxID=3911 RepID=UPI00273BA704|nr:defensin-like protein 183 [Vicia villosa]
MANQMSKSFCFFAILVLVFAVQCIKIDGECTKIMGTCGKADCMPHCIKYARGVVRVLKASCSYFNLCTCTLDRPPPREPTCTIVMGACTNDCNTECCNNKCQKSYPNTGSGACVDAWEQNINLCLCSYNR